MGRTGLESDEEPSWNNVCLDTIASCTISFSK